MITLIMQMCNTPKAGIFISAAEENADMRLHGEDNGRDKNLAAKTFCTLYYEGSKRRRITYTFSFATSLFTLL